MAFKSSGLGKMPGLRMRIALWALAAIVGIILYAWIDGGEEPLRQITQTVEVTLPATQYSELQGDPL